MVAWRRPQVWAMAMVLAALLAAPAPVVAAAPGDRDPTFGVDGGLTTGFDGSDAQARAVAVQPDGKIIAAGHAGLRFALARYLPDGTLESSFGDGGRVVTDFAVARPAAPQGSSSECSPASCFGNSAQAFALALQPDGNVVVAGGVVRDGFGGFALARYLPNGRLDPAFGENGTVTTRMDSIDARAFALAIEPDGKLVAGGYALRDSYDFALVRYLPDGTPDPEFGHDGFVETDFFNGLDQVRGVAVQPDGRLLATGFALRGGKYQFAVARYLPDGRPDTDFGDGGKATTHFPDGDAQGFAVVLQADGKFVVAGGAVAAGNQAGLPRLSLVGGGRRDDARGVFALAGYLPDGQSDASFGVNGKLIVRFEAGAAAGASSLVLQPDGKLVAAGFLHDGNQFQFALVRLLPTGTLDPAFGNDGKLSAGFNGDAQAFGLALQPDRKLVVAGVAVKADHSEFALTRHENDVLLGGDSGGEAGCPSRIAGRC